MSDDYWFPKKKGFGWGWGPPRNPRGWYFLIGWLILMTLGVRSLRGVSGVIFFTGMIALLGLILYFKGEPPGSSV